MGTLLCQDCNSVIEMFEYEKVTVLYGKCSGCAKKPERKNEK